MLFVPEILCYRVQCVIEISKFLCKDQRHHCDHLLFLCVHNYFVYKANCRNSYCVVCNANAWDNDLPQFLKFIKVLFIFKGFVRSSGLSGTYSIILVCSITNEKIYLVYFFYHQGNLCFVAYFMPGLCSVLFLISTTGVSALC